MFNNNDFYSHYLQIKKDYSGFIVFLRLGDFYEVFGADAQTVSKVLDIMLTARSVGTERVPMCGVPYHTLDRYVAQLTARGFRVALAETVG